jgi:hypothetical protein
MEYTPWLGLSLLAPQQAQKEWTVNTAILALEAVLVGEAVFDLPTSPTTPEIGIIYVTGDAPQGDWQHYPHHLAWFYSGWHFHPLKSGLRLWQRHPAILRRWDGHAWSTILFNPKENKS